MQTSVKSRDYNEKKKISLKDFSGNDKEKLSDLSDEELQELKKQAIEEEDYDIAKMIKQKQIERKEKVPETEEATEEKRDDDTEYKAIQEEKNASHEENLKKAGRLIAKLNEENDEKENDEKENDEKENDEIVEIEKITKEISKEVEVSSSKIENLQKESEEIFSDIDEITKEIQNMRKDFRSLKGNYYGNHVVFSPERIKSLGYKIKNVEDKFNNWLKSSNELHEKIVDENKKLSQNIDLLYNNGEPLIGKKDLQFFANLHRIKETQNKTLSSIEQGLRDKILDKQLNAPMLGEVFSGLGIMNGGVAQEIWLMLRNIYNNAKFKSNIQNIKHENDEIKRKIYDFGNFVFNKR